MVLVRHDSTEEASPLRPDSPGNAFKDEVQPNPAEKEIRKSTNSAFVGTELEAYLRGGGGLLASHHVFFYWDTQQYPPTDNLIARVFSRAGVASFTKTIMAEMAVLNAICPRSPSTLALHHADF